jgi:hypothetical protein
VRRAFAAPHRAFKASAAVTSRAAVGSGILLVAEWIVRQIVVDMHHAIRGARRIRLAARG